MEQIYCMNCLRQTPAYPCPLCGYNPCGTPKVAQALEQSILHGRYLTGRALEKNTIEIIYRGLDLERNQAVTLREYFPSGQAQRNADGSLKWVNAPQQEENALLAQARRHLPEGAILDSFSENNTVYTVCRPAAPRPAKHPPVKQENEWIPFLLALAVLGIAGLAAAPWVIPLLA